MRLENRHAAQPLCPDHVRPKRHIKPLLWRSGRDDALDGESRHSFPDLEIAPFPTGTSFPVMYAVWAATVTAMYHACLWYARFKAAKPVESVWRLL